MKYYRCFQYGTIYVVLICPDTDFVLKTFMSQDLSKSQFLVQNNKGASN